MNLCLFSLSIVDIVFLVCAIYFSAVSILSELDPNGFAKKIYINSLSYGVGINFALRTTVSLYIVVIAVDRYLCVAYPLRVSSMVKTRTMAMILVFLAAFAQLGFLFQPFKYDVIENKMVETPQWIMIPSKEYLDNKMLVDFIVCTIFSVCVPLFTLLILSLVTLVTVVRLTTAAAWRRRTSSTSVEHSKQQVMLTKMLIIASCIYIVSMAPMVSIKIVRLVVEDFSSYGVYSRLYLMCNTAASGLPVINSSVNFCIYYRCSSRYKTELLNIVQCYHCKFPKLGLASTVAICYLK